MERNLLYRLIGGIIFFTFMFNASFAQGMLVDDLSRAMNDGDIEMLSKFFGSNVDMTINKTQSTYSSTQAQMVLKKFFDKSKVHSFRLEKAGKSGNNATYTIGILDTDKGVYKVYFYLVPRENTYMLQTIRIEK